MDKPVAAIELGSKKIKLVVGYELNGQVYVLYAITKPYGHIVESGTITDMSKVVESISNFKVFSDDSAKVKLSISEAAIALPPVGLEIYTGSQMLGVISPESKVSNVEIKSLHVLFHNGATTLNSSVVDVIPSSYYLDEGRMFINPPIGQVSSTIMMNANVHLLPTEINNSYANAFASADMRLKRSIIAPFAAINLIVTDETMPKDYVLVDIGSDSTTVSLVGQSNLFASRMISWGGDKITEKIIQTFNINETEAEKIKITYGIDRRQMNFKAPVCRSDDGQGHEIKHYVDELNKLIKEELDFFTKALNNAINDMFSSYENPNKGIPMVMIGGGSRLSGLVDYLLPKIPNEEIKLFLPRSLGARNATYTNCLGMILAIAKYPTYDEEGYTRVGKITRDSK